MDSTLALLALPSLAALALVVMYVARNRGWRAAALYFGPLVLYAAARGQAIRFVTEQRLGTAFPYLMSRPLVELAGVSLQEAAGWALAATLGLLLGERLLRRLAEPAPAPHRCAVAAALVLTLVCLAVESAAIASGWWTWTLVVAPDGLLRVPRVALLDWGFVAFDFLLPYLLWSRPAGRLERALGSACFPLHMLGHTWVAPLGDALPLAGNDLVHVGLLAYVLARAARERGGGRSWSEPQLAWAPTLAACIVALSCALAHLVAGVPAGAWSALPLLLAAAFTAGSARQPPAREQAQGRPWLAWALIAVAAAAELVLVRAPETRLQQRFVQGLEQGVRLLNQGALPAAEARLREALALRPENPGGHTLLALALIKQGRPQEARAELEQALRYEPSSRDALLLAIQFDLAAGQPGRAAERARLGARAHRARAEFPYLEAVALGAAGRGRPAATKAVSLAAAGEPGSLQALEALARSFGDEATLSACREARARGKP